MNNIDLITYTATSIDETTGYITDITATYYVPFLDYFLVFSVLCFTILFVWFAKIMLYPKKQKIVNKINIKNY